MRAKSVVYSRQRKKKVFRRAKGAYATKKNRWRITIQHMEKSMRHMYRDRKKNKRNFRSLWIVRLNAGARENGITYSRFMSGLRKANVVIDRKMLADMAVRDNMAFKQLTELAKSTLAAK